MPWYYADGGTQKGPLTDEEFQTLVSAGTIGAETLVWRDGMPAWQPYRTVAPAATQTSQPPNTGVPPVANQTTRCSNCGGTFAPDNLLLLGGGLVCPTCKPVVLQRLKEGAAAPTGPAGDPEELVRRATAVNRRISAGHCISRAWDLMKGNLGPLLGVSLLIMVIMIAAGGIPFIGSCISLVVTGPLLAGLYWYFLKHVRGEPATIADAFAPFTTHFVQTMLGSMIPSIFAYLPLLPLGLYVGARAAMSQSEPEIDGVAIALIVLAVPVMLYLFAAWAFTLPLIVDQRLRFWDAMGVSRRVVTHHLGSFLLLMLATMGIVLLGLLAFCVGVIFALPILFGSYMYAYQDLFGPGEQANPSAGA